MSRPARKLSGLQREVLALYRAYQRQISKKIASPKCALSADKAPQVRAHIRSQFEANLGLRKSNFVQIEHCLRKGQKQFKMFQNDAVAGFSNPFGAKTST